jgi:hypothetical protein
MSEQKIKVVIGKYIKKTSVLIDPNVSASDNPESGAAARNIIEVGTDKGALLKKHYGKR